MTDHPNAAEVTEMLARAKKFPTEATIESDGSVTITDPIYRLARAYRDLVGTIEEYPEFINASREIQEFLRHYHGEQTPEAESKRV